MVRLSIHEKYHILFKAIGYSSAVVSIYLFIAGYDFAKMLGQNFINFVVLLTIALVVAFMEIKVPIKKTKNEVINGAAGDAN